MSISKCIVKLKDTHGTEHTATVYADSLYGAVIRGLNLLQAVGWESDTDETIKQVEVEIHHEPTRHAVDVPRLLEWVWSGHANKSVTDKYAEQLKEDVEWRKAVAEKTGLGFSLPKLLVGQLGQPSVPNVEAAKAP